ncbi:MAG: hypothetical protein ACR2NF_11110 [Pirellulales bacterium]
MKNKSLQFIAGVFVIYLTYQLHAAGWFAAVASVLSAPEDGFRGSVLDLFTSALPLVVDAICTVGIIALAFLTFIYRLAKPLFVKLLILLDKKLESYGIDLYELDANIAPAPRKLDLTELESVLGRILDRVQNLENKNEEG